MFSDLLLTLDLNVLRELSVPHGKHTRLLLVHKQGQHPHSYLSPTTVQKIFHDDEKVLFDKAYFMGKCLISMTDNPCV